MIIYLAVLLIVLVGLAIIAGITAFVISYIGYRNTFQELMTEPLRWMDVAGKQGYQFFLCPDCGHPIIRGGFDEGGVCFCGACDAVYEVTLVEKDYKLVYLGDVTDIDIIQLKALFTAQKEF